MAQGEDISHLEIGREVYLRQIGDSYLFTVKSHLRKVREALKGLFSREPQALAKAKLERKIGESNDRSGTKPYRKAI